MTGGSYHAGVAVLFAGGNTAEAVQAAEDSYAEALSGQVVLDAEKPLLQREITIARKAVELYCKHYQTEPFQVMHPEVDFTVAIPNTLHHCWFAHRLLHPDITYEKCYYNFPEHWGIDYPKECWQPHYLRGTTDALVSWNRMLWLLEHKTAAIDSQTWWDKWFLDLQITGYTYGVHKALGIRPQGVILNKINKPKKNESLAMWSLKENIFQREPILRADEDLVRFERQFTQVCDDYERAFRLGHIYMNPDSCLNYNRRCYYFDMCRKHKETDTVNFRKREMDYVEAEYYKILNLEPPKPPEATPAPKPYDLASIFPKEENGK